MESSHSSHKNVQIDNSDSKKANLFKCADYEKYSNFFHSNINIEKKYDTIREFLMNGSLEVDCLGDTRLPLELIRYFFIGLENYEDFKRTYFLENSFLIYKVDFIDCFHFGSEVVPLAITLEPINLLLLSLLYRKLMCYFLGNDLKRCFKNVFSFSKEDLLKTDRFYYLACRGFADFSICKMCPYKDECKQKQIVK